MPVLLARLTLDQRPQRNRVPFDVPRLVAVARPGHRPGRSPSGRRTKRPARLGPLTSPRARLSRAGTGGPMTGLTGPYESEEAAFRAASMHVVVTGGLR